MKVFLLLPIVVLLYDCQKFTLKANPCEFESKTMNNLHSALLYIPNTFTPNDDGINDTFKIVFVDTSARYSLAQFEIMDSRSNTIFTNESSLSWHGTESNGKDAKSGAYPYRAVFNAAESEPELEVEGTLLLTRACDDVDDWSCARFPDQIHPRMGFIFQTQEPLLEACDE